MSIARRTLRHAPRPAIAAAILGCVLYVAGASLPTVGLFDEGQVGDTPAYRTYGDAVLDGRVPYRDFYVEYPPGALPVFALPAVGSEDGYAGRFKLLALVLGLATVLVVVAALARTRATPRRLLAAAALVGVAPATLGPVFLVNYDVWPALLATAGVAALALGSSGGAGALLACGIAAKVYPLAVVPLALVRAGARASVRRVAIAGIATFAAILAPFAILAPGAIGFDLSVAVRRPLQIESLGSSLLLVAHQLGLYEASVNSDFNSQNLGGALPSLLAALGSVVALALVALVVVLYRRDDRDAERTFVAAAATVAAVVAFGKILSPQYLVWLVPLVALVPSVAAYACLFLAMALTHVWFPSRYGELVGLGDVAWVVLARNIALVALVVVLMRRLAR